MFSCGRPRAERVAGRCADADSFAVAPFLSSFPLPGICLRQNAASNEPISNRAGAHGSGTIATLSLKMAMEVTADCADCADYAEEGGLESLQRILLRLTHWVSALPFNTSA